MTRSNMNLASQTKPDRPRNEGLHYKAHTYSDPIDKFMIVNNEPRN